MKQHFFVYVLGISTAMALLKNGNINCRGLSSDKLKRRDIFLNCRQNYDISFLNKGNNKITELRTILQRESQNS
jgi:hypothetical protein